MKLYKIYKWTNTITNMSYIGQTCRSLAVRQGKNMSEYKPCRRFWEAITKYGTDCWTLEILHNNLTFDKALELESHEIRINNTLHPNGYNLTTGKQGYECSDDSRKRMRKSQRDRVKRGNHNFTGGKIQRENNLRRSKEGTNVFTGKSNPTYKRLKDGTHHFLKENRTPEKEKKRLESFKKTRSKNKMKEIIKSGQLILFGD